jgi:mRNA interferase HigB
MKQATWKTPAELKARYPSASILPGNRVVFNIAHNDFRIGVAIAFDEQIVRVKRIGTHVEYDAWGAAW